MTPCTRRGCTGEIQDGYCSECGHAPGPPAENASTPAGSSQVPYRPSTRASSPEGTASSTSASSGSQRGGLGANLVVVPPVPCLDPDRALLPDPHVPERKRLCSNADCKAPVGRSKNGHPGRIEGFCPHCSKPFSFKPRLVKGDLLGGQYEVEGCLAHGGLGWIYAARDRNVDNRWRVLKGLLDQGDADAQAAAVAERRFLAAVDHPNIVRIYNFVEHPDRWTGADVGYIVMEYVGGKSLRQLHEERRQVGDRLPLEQVLAYGLEVLPALGYLHDHGLVYCDFKPDNVIHSAEQLKLIDLGGVRRINDTDSAIWGTTGYQDPHVAEHGPSVATDLYTVARTMAVLSFEFPEFSSEEWAGRLPGPDRVELFARHDSYHRLLLRATNPDPEQRFESAAAMAEQLRGVLREVLSAKDGRPRPASSRRFGPELRVVAAEADGFSAEPVARRPAGLALPDPQVDPADPQAGLLATVGGSDPEEMLLALAQVPDPTLETRIRLVRARLDQEELAQVCADLEELDAAYPGDWRIDWYRGVAALMAGQLDRAEDAFQSLLDAFPGEAAPKLALALCAEYDGACERAAHYYETVWRTDNSYVSAAFGLARARWVLNDKDGAAQTLESVPEGGRFGVAARLAAVGARVRLHREGAPLSPEFFDVANRLEKLNLEPERRERMATEVLEVTLEWLLSGPPATPIAMGDPSLVLGHVLTERELRLGIERSYRMLARMTPEPRRRVALVDKANSIRPRSWL